MEQIIYKWDIDSYDELEKILEDWFNVIDWTVNLRNLWLSTLEWLWEYEYTVTKDFIIAWNNLKHLRWCPDEVDWTFSCEDNQITSLKYGPFYVWKNYECNQNYLKSLEWISPTIKWSFSCQDNDISSYDFFPDVWDDNILLFNNDFPRIEKWELPDTYIFEWKTYWKNENLTESDYDCLLTTKLDEDNAYDQWLTIKYIDTILQFIKTSKQIDYENINWVNYVKIWDKKFNKKFIKKFK